MKFLALGCIHGSWEQLINEVNDLDDDVSFVLCTGDLQMFRNLDDMASASIPQKYWSEGSFWKLYTQDKDHPLVPKIPIITIAGNHESTSYLAEIPFGGWVAPNVYYMGHSSLLHIVHQGRMIKLGGISGIFHYHTYRKPRITCLPIRDTFIAKDWYRVRHPDVTLLTQSILMDSTNAPLVVATHDWPAGITRHGTGKLYGKQLNQARHSPETIGSMPSATLLATLLRTPTAQLTHWVCAHMHTKIQWGLHAPDVPSDSQRRPLAFCCPDTPTCSVLALGKYPRFDSREIVEVADQAVPKDLQDIYCAADLPDTCSIFLSGTSCRLLGGKKRPLLLSPARFERTQPGQSAPFQSTGRFEMVENPQTSWLAGAIPIRADILKRTLAIEHRRTKAPARPSGDK
eukprot:gnl/Dysnectes_brevis/2469_a2952_1207.p1 GENE.gnl/Dysnectes_brevis/2469_a2952_1207~~gnl/Dysnectes_brevis/2469_a2952_1207.p1  ORF type:complete len:401 (-),score=88.92 gnl/Dysnectes_brevis/2469_a2952_1207:30-1232(-)